jgi:preprotein translocase subunit SecE
MSGTEPGTIGARRRHGNTRPTGSGGTPRRVSEGGKVTETRSTTSSRGSDPSKRRTSPGLFYRQVLAELRKVVWPTREQLVTYFLVVLVFVVVMITIVSILDFLFGTLVFKVFA